MSTSATRPTRARQARNFTLALPDAVVTSFASTSAYIHSDDEHDHPKLHKKKSLKKVPVKSKLAQEKDTAAIDHAEESPPRKVAKNANGKKVSKNKEELQVEATMYEEVPVGVDEMVPSKVKKVKKARKIQVVEEAAVKQEKGKGKRRRVDDAEDELRVESVHLHVEQSVIDGAWRPLATLTKDAIISELASLIPAPVGKAKSKYNFESLLVKMGDYFTNALVPAPSLATRKSGTSKSKIEIYVGTEIEEQITLLQASLPPALALLDQLEGQLLQK